MNLEKPVVRFDEFEIKKAINRLHEDFQGISGKDLVLIYPSGGILPIRAWPKEYYCRVSMELIRHGYAIGVIGLESDKELAKLILTHCQSESCVDLTGYTKSIRELMILFHIASLLITNDGGPGQFAAMTPIKTIIFYGPETPALYGTLDDDSFIFYTPLSCSPCLTAYNHRHSPCDGNNLCLKYIEPAEVISKALEILSRRGEVASPKAVDMKERH
jgi:ADP-heptose:LPS heptosyltransferase